jgi:hypothetical protein
LQIAGAHLLIAAGDAQKRLARLEGEPFFDLVCGKLELILVLGDARAEE